MEYKTREQQQRFYNSSNWKKVRAMVRKRDNNECVMCREQGYVTIDTNERRDDGRKKIQLVVHHIRELEDHPELALDMNNLITICYQHHELIHNRIERFTRKNKWYQDEKW